MTRLEYVRHQFVYEHWANAHVIDALASKSLEGSKAVNLMAHILISQGAWLARMDDISTDGWDFFPKLTLEHCRLLLEKNRRKFDELLDGMTEERFDESKQYHNSFGEDFSASFASVLSHLLLHGAHHRGQIATLMRDAGKEPARFDYIVYGFSNQD